MGLGSKMSLLTKPEVDFVLKNANFTYDEEKIFKMLSAGMTITQISGKTCMCERTINRKMLRIKDKICKLGVL